MKNAPAVEPGRGDEVSTKDRPHLLQLDHEHQDRHVDPRAAILLRAASRYNLLRHGEITLDDAFSENFVDDFLEAVGAIWRRQMFEHWDRIWFEDRAERLRKWRR